MKFASELLKGSAKNIILSVLAKQEMYGYEIIKSVREQTDELISLGEGSMYPALHELEKHGFLKSRWVRQDSAPDRKYYSITKKGQRQLQEAKGEWKLFSQALQKIYYGIDGN